jgi:hypothetical protein
VGLDLFKQGEFLNPGESHTENPRTTYSGGKELAADSWQRSPVYYYGYNDSTFARRVHDILTAVTFVRNHETWDTKEVTVIGLKGAGHWVAAARAVAGDAINKAVIETGGFRFSKLASDWDADFLPGAVKYGDLTGFLVQPAPSRLLLADDDPELAKQIAATYRAAGSADAASVIANFGADQIAEFVSE